MPQLVTVPDVGVKHLINQAYEAGGKYQWARETLVNALQARATWVEFGVERQLLEQRGVGKRYVADNGIGMNGDQLREYMSSFGGGGRPIGLNENFGQGQKSSCYPWNTYGMLVLSWTPETPDGLGIWIHQNKDGNYALREWDIEHGDEGSWLDNVFVPEWDDELGIDLSQLHFPEIQKAGHGTVFVMLGKSLHDDTRHGDKGRDENTIRGIAAYLNTRFIDIPDHIDVRAVGLESSAESDDRRVTKDTVITLSTGERRTWHPRVVKGVKSFITEEDNGKPREYSSGTVKVGHNTEIDWFLTGTPGAGGSGSYGPTPGIMVEYSATFDGISINETYTPRTGIRAYRAFGIGEPTVASRLWLIVRPPTYVEGSTEWGVLPQAARGMLISKGGGELPWSEWEQDFYDNLPIEIKAAIQKAHDDRAKNDSQIPELSTRLKEKLSRLALRFRPLKVVEKDSGSTTGGRTSQRTGLPRKGTGKRLPNPKPNPHKPNPHKPNLPVGGKGETPILDPKLGNPVSGEKTRRGDGVPTVEWIPKTEWSAMVGANDLAPEAIAAYWDCPPGENVGGGSIKINSGFSVFEEQFAYWSRQYKVDEGAVVDLVKEAYTMELLSKVTHAFSLRSNEFSQTNLNCLLTEPALTMSVLGLSNVEQYIATVGGSRFGARIIQE